MFAFLDGQEGQAVAGFVGGSVGLVQGTSGASQVSEGENFKAFTFAQLTTSTSKLNSIFAISLPPQSVNNVDPPPLRSCSLTRSITHFVTNRPTATSPCVPAVARVEQVMPSLSRRCAAHFA